MGTLKQPDLNEDSVIIRANKGTSNKQKQGQGNRNWSLSGALQVFERFGFGAFVKIMVPFLGHLNW